MSVKPTTAVFHIRGSETIDCDFQNSPNALATLEIPTNLDTLNREVLLIQEIDFDVAGVAQWVGVLSRNNGSQDPADAFINGTLSVVLTEVDPAVDPNALLLSSPHFIASKEMSSVSGLMFDTQENPDSASYSSQVGGDHPLFTTASESLFLTVASAVNNNDATAGTAPPVRVRGMARVMCQRGKADADTYAAILTGLFA